MMPSAIGKCQNSPQLQPDPWACYEKALGDLERHIRDLANPGLFRRITKKFIDLSIGELDVKKGISDAFVADFPEAIVQYIKEWDEHIKSLADQGVNDLEKMVRICLEDLAKIKVEIAPRDIVRLFFINPEPLTKKGIQEHNRQICLIYAGKRGDTPNYIPCAIKPGGSALGTIFAKTPSNPGKIAKRWLGKVGLPRGFLSDDPASHTTRTKKEMNLDTIREKLIYDLYEELGRGFFKLPKTRLSEQALINGFMPMTLPMSQFCLVHSDEDKKITASLRIMSRYVEGYHDFAKAFTQDRDGSCISVVDFMKKWHRPPDQLLTPQGKSVPLVGFVEMIAVGRILADTDSFGGRGDNAGFIWVKEDGEIIRANTVKIDPGEAFNFIVDEADSMPNNTNWLLNTLKDLNGRKLEDKKDLQIAQNTPQLRLHWESLTELQKDIFLGVLFNASRYLQTPDILNYLIYRDGLFCHSPVAKLPGDIAQKFQYDMVEWLSLQLEIYKEELEVFHQKYPEQALRAHYIDACGELSVPMKKETFPIRDLFTELVIVDGREKKNDRFSNTIVLEKLFEGNQKVLVFGHAGVGKSTLCQKIAHDWASGRLWNSLFDVVYWIPLRNLNDLKVGEDPQDFFFNVALPTLFTDVATIDALRKGIHTKKVLLILDGYDEASPELAQIVEKLIHETPFHILLTSRPGQIDTLKVDQIVENIGFSDTQIRAYIDKFSKRHTDNFAREEKGLDLFTIIKNHPNLCPLAHIPLQLQMILALYEKTGNIQHASSLTKLYQVMTNELYHWHLRGEKIDEKDAILATLGEIALIGLLHGKLIIPHRKIQHLITKPLLEAGLLKKIEGAKNCYQFIHFTFQEFLAALYISHKSPEKQRIFIVKNRHEPSYQLVLAFLAGLNSSDPKKVQDFFAALYQKSNTIALLTPYLLELTLRCLNECEEFDERIPAIDEFVAQDPGVWDTPLDRYKFSPFLFAAFQSQTQALKWLANHYPQLLQQTGQFPNLPTNGVTALSLCAYKGNVDGMMFLLQKDRGLIAKYEASGRTPLHSAASGGQVKAMEFLLQQDPELLSKYDNIGWTPLHSAALFGHVEAMKFLVQQDPELLSKYTWSNWTPLDAVASYGWRVEAIKFLIQQDPRLLSKYRGTGESTLLHSAAQKGDVEMMKFLVQHDPELLSKYDTSGWTPLHIAVEGWHVEAVKCLIQQDPTLLPKYRNIHGETVLHAAAWKEDVEMMKFLLQQDPELLSKDTPNGWTSLHSAAYGGGIEAMKFLLQQDPELLLKYTNIGYTPLHAAASGGSVEAMKFLIQEDPQLLLKKDNSGGTLLHAAASGGSVEAMKFLIQQDPKLLSTYEKYDIVTFLYAATRKGDVEAMKFLIQEDPMLLLYRERDNDGKTLLHAAAYEGGIEAMKFLIQVYPILLSRKNKSGRTPLHAAAQGGQVEAMEFLLQQDPTLLSKYGDDGETALHAAVSGGHVEAMKFLVQQDINLLSKCTNDGWTPMHTAACHGHIKAGEFLLKSSPELLNLPNHRGETPLKIAQRLRVGIFCKWVRSLGLH